MNMHTEIEKMLALAEENGHLTEKQREIIVRKADAMGEDMDEVIFRLEAIPSAVEFVARPQESAKLGKVEKCPHCGAPVTDTMLACPECGFVFAEETGAGKKARKDIAELERKLIEAAKPTSKDEELQDPQAADRRMARVIQAFPLPVTKEGLLLFLEYAYSNYSGASDPLIIKVWNGKMSQAYLTLSRLGKDDPKIQQELMFYQPYFNETDEDREKKELKLWVRNALLYFVVMGFLLLLMYLGKFIE